jgi:hypothetical protein
MAVKVMWAPVLRPQGGDEGQKSAPVKAVEPPAPRKAAAEKPRRRRSSVFDADGNEVFITLLCLKCHKMRPLSQFGLRRMADGAIRNQPWCRGCRSEASPKKRKEPAQSGDSTVSGESLAPARAPEPRDAGRLIAEVTAALHRGRA